MKNIPTLRFPGFEGEWENVKIGDVAKIKHGFAFRGEFFGTNGPFIVVTPGNFDPQGGFRFQGEKEKYYLDENFPKEYMLEKGDLLTAMTEQAAGLIGNAIIIPKSNLFLHNQRLGLFQVNVRALREFLFHVMMRSPIREKFSKTAAGTKVRHTSPQLIEGIEINIPTLPEQTKIADFLSAVDAKLQALKKNKAALESYKKGLMQQLFSQTLRFKDQDGNDFPDWEEKRLGEVTYKVDKKNKQREELPIYSISNKNGFVPQSDQFEGLDSIERGYDTSLYKIIEANTFAYNPARINVGSIGFSGNLGRVIVSSLYVCFKTIESVSSAFLNYFFDTFHFKNSVLTKGEGGVRTYLFYENFSEITISLPSLAEQTKIADFLSSLDAKIQGTAVAVEKLEVWKKGLLQRLFV